MIYFKQYFFLGVKMHELILLKNFLLPHNFQCIDFLFAPKFNELDSSESAIAKSGEYFQIISLEFSENMLAILFEGI